MSLWKKPKWLKYLCWSETAIGREEGRRWRDEEDEEEEEEEKEEEEEEKEESSGVWA